MKISVYLIVNSLGACRVVKQRPHRQPNEAVFKVNVTMPDPPPMTEIDVSIPQFDPTVTVTETEPPPEHETGDRT